MREKAADEYRNDRAVELERLGQLLVDKNILSDDSPLKSAAGLCRSWKERKGDRAFWKCSVDSLLFPTMSAETLKNVKPDLTSNVTIELTVEATGWCLDEYTDLDPFCELVVSFFVEGTAHNGQDKLCCAWHLDRHIIEDAPCQKKEGEQPVSTIQHPIAAHPFYHFHFGGRRVWELANYGFQMLLESPRIAHPPLDAILAVDFILSNYYGDIWADLIQNDTLYSGLVESAQKRIWRPYALATAAAWPYHNVASSWQAELLWPQLYFDAKKSSEVAVKKKGKARR